MHELHFEFPQVEFVADKNHGTDRMYLILFSTKQDEELNGVLVLLENAVLLAEKQWSRTSGVH